MVTSQVIMDNSNYKNYKLLPILENEMKSNSSLHPQIFALVQLFLKYLKEPRYQSPLTIIELSKLFQFFYKDLNSLALGLFTQSNSAKKQLISSSDHFNLHPTKFDYLLAIANYSTSSIKLLKRSDNEALKQLRIFNYYKFLKIFESIELAQFSLFNSINNGENISLYDKIFRFNQKDIIYQEFLDEKLESLKQMKLSFTKFHETDDEILINFVEGLEAEELQEINLEFTKLSKNITPYSKLVNIVNIQKKLIKLFSKIYKSNQINNDLLFPSLIYLIIYKLDINDIYLNFIFIKNFIHFIDPLKIELVSLNLNSSYTPTDTSNKAILTKIKKSNLFELLNLDENEEPDEQLDDDNEFFNNDRSLIQYISSNFLNNGELNYYLTNFEAIIVFLSNIKLAELSPEETTTNKLLLNSISALVDDELLTHFQFPDGKLTEELKSREDQENSQNRSRSSSILNTISNKLNETRSRSNSSVMNSIKSSNISLTKENFPTLSSNDLESINTPTTESDNNSGLSMMKNIIGRFSSVSVSQFKPIDEQSQQTESADESSIHKRSSSLISKLSPKHSRTRSSSLETATQSQTSKRNTITTKLTNGVSELMTKLNSTTASQPNPINKNISNSSLHSLNNNQPTDLNDSTATLHRRPDFARSRTTSLQVMDRWFNNISNTQSYHQSLNSTNEEDGIDMNELVKYQNAEFESLSIKDLKGLKSYYDQLCHVLLENEIKTNNKTKDNNSL